MSFNLEQKVIIVTGGAGLLGQQHCQAINKANGIPVVWDKVSSSEYSSYTIDLTKPDDIKNALEKTLKKHGAIYGLVNNVANNPKVEESHSSNWTRFENYDLNLWQDDLAVGLSSYFLCSQLVGTYMAKNNEGVIVNIASDLSVFSPDQRLYRQKGLANNQQPVKPVSYSVVKHGIIGLTKYLSTYWSENNIRVNALSPGGIETNQNHEFIKRLENLIPMGRMAKQDEYQDALLFLLSNSSKYMTGQNLVIDGGRSVW